MVSLNIDRSEPRSERVLSTDMVSALWVPACSGRGSGCDRRKNGAHNFTRRTYNTGRAHGETQIMTKEQGRAVMLKALLGLIENIDPGDLGRRWEDFDPALKG
jgi:hypothetical protein